MSSSLSGAFRTPEAGSRAVSRGNSREDVTRRAVSPHETVYRSSRVRVDSDLEQAWERASVYNTSTGWANFGDLPLCSELVDVRLSGTSERSSFTSVVKRKRLQARHTLKVVGSTVAGAPHTVIIPLLLLCLFIAVGLVAVFLSAKDLTESEKQASKTLAEIAAMGMEHMMTSSFTYVLAELSGAVRMQPRVPDFMARFDAVAADAVLQAPPKVVWRVDLAPFGVIQGAYPADRSMIGKEDTTDFLLPPPDGTELDFQAAQKAITTKQPVAMYKVLPDTPFGNETAMVILHPIFIEGVDEGELFGNRVGPTFCRFENCYDAVTRTKWWGFVAVAMYPCVVLYGHGSRLDMLKEQGFKFRFYVPKEGLLGYATDKIIVESDPLDELPGALEVTRKSPDGQLLILKVAPASGSWTPSWLPGAIAAVACISVILAVLLFLMLLSRQRHRELVENMLPPRVAKRLALGKNYCESFASVTLLFSDIVSYTTMSSTMTPEELVELLNEIYSHYDALVEKHGLYKVETIGDAFMCVGGCPEACPPAEAALRIARMARDMMEFTKSFVTADGRKIQIRIGCYTGPVTAAVVGKKMHHMCLVGDTVNTASRMESNSLPGKIHIGAPTAKLLESGLAAQEFKLTPRGTIEVKGKGPMSTFWLQPSGSSKLPAQVSSDSSDIVSTATTIVNTTIPGPHPAVAQLQMMQAARCARVASLCQEPGGSSCRSLHASAPASPTPRSRQVSTNFSLAIANISSSPLGGSHTGGNRVHSDVQVSQRSLGGPCEWDGLPASTSQSGPADLVRQL